jgi:quinol monooxygenase YgiN
MINIIFDFKTKPTKNLEFMQSAGSIIINLRNVKGCMGIDLQQDGRDKNKFKLNLNWQNQKLIRELLKSSEYEVLEGALRVLCEILTIELINGQQTTITDLLKSPTSSIKRQILSEL